MANYIATSEELTAVADAIRAKGGITDPLVFPTGFVDAVNSMQSGGTGGVSLDHTVTIKDDSGNDVAIYSVKEGIGNIAAPSGVTAKRWVDVEGNEVKFPVNPVEDMEIIADNSLSNTDVLYEVYGVDRTVYPYVVMVEQIYYGSAHLIFAKSMNKYSEYKYSIGQGLSCSSNVTSSASLALTDFISNPKTLTNRVSQNTDNAVWGATNYNILITNYVDIDTVTM